jgi:hypothetical protein
VFQGPLDLALLASPYSEATHLRADHHNRFLEYEIWGFQGGVTPSCSRTKGTASIVAVLVVKVAEVEVIVVCSIFKNTVKKLDACISL